MTDAEEKLAKEFEVYRELSTTDKKIDVATLMINALQKQQTNMLTDKEKRWAYLIALGVPPFGLIFALKFYVSDKTDGKKAAYMCIGLTVVSIFLAWLFLKLILGSSGTSLNQIQQIQPSDIQQLLQ